MAHELISVAIPSLIPHRTGVLLDRRSILFGDVLAVTARTVPVSGNSGRDGSGARRSGHVGKLMRSGDIVVGRALVFVGWKDDAGGAAVEAFSLRVAGCTPAGPR